MKKFQNKIFIFVFKVAHLEVISRICVKNRVKNDIVLCNLFFSINKEIQSGKIQDTNVLFSKTTLLVYTLTCLWKRGLDDLLAVDF